MLWCLSNSDMFILSVHWDFRSLWAALTIPAQFYTICLLAGAAYSTYSLACIVVCLRRNARDKAVIRKLDDMRTKTQALREFHTMLFLLFGLCGSNEVANVLRGIQLSFMSLSAAKIEVFEPVARFSLLVFAVLIFLHGSLWVVARQLREASRFSGLTGNSNPLGR